MNLLIVTQYFWPENFRINDLVKELINRGHNVTILTGKPNYPDGKFFKDFLTNPHKYKKYHSAEILRVPLVPRGRSKFALFLNYVSFAISASFIGLWKIRNKKFDVIFAFQPSPVTVGLPAIFLKKIKNAKLIFWVLDLWPDTLEALQIIRSNFYLSLVGSLVSFIYNRCDLILVQSKSFISQVNKYSKKCKKVKYFPGWSDLNFNFKKTTFANEISRKNHSFIIMFTGNIGEAQDFKSVLIAANILKMKGYNKIHWIIVGGGRKEIWLRNEIKNMQLNDSISMLGNYSLDRMPSFFKHADVLFLSLRNQKVFSMTIPAKLQTYFASGKPILGMIDGEASDAIKKSKSGFVSPAGRPDILAGLALKLYKMDKNKLAKMGRNGLLYSKKEFDRDTLISELEDMFDEIIY
jgi:colanic acid biosynthesis glycosyl transferase WcaI